MVATERNEFQITGMHCESCVALVHETLLDLDGIVSADVDLDSGTAEVAFNPELIDPAGITAAIVEAGYEAAQVG